MSAGGTDGNIFIGAAISAVSERLVIERLHRDLSAARVPFALLANFQLGGRQLDCVVVTEQRVVVVEVKASVLPVRGHVDGDWARLDIAGEWRHYTNGYRQALGQKERLVDAMRRRGDIGRFYPDAAVVFAKPLPPGSSLTGGNFKVSVTDIDRFVPGGDGDRHNPWTLTDWRAFAAGLGMRPASLREVLGGEAQEHAFAIVRDYRQRVASELLRDGGHWLAEDEGQRETLRMAGDDPLGAYIHGPSGCGKTLAARWLAGQLAQAGESVLFVSAKDFAGSWARLLRREMALVTDTGAGALLRAFSVTGAPLRIVLDGINEIGVARDPLLRSLQAMARKYDARVIVTGQSEKPDRLAGITAFAVEAPSLDLKSRIAAVGTDRVSDRVRDVLRAVASGFEAAMAAEVGTALPVDASRQLLVDQFIRHRLVAVQRAGSAGLRLFAKRLIETTSFSMNETIFDELMFKGGLASTDIDTLMAARILVRRGGRVSFAHEILLSACAAAAYAQLAPEAGAKFAFLLEVPVLEPIATDIVSVIEDPNVVRMVLETTRNPALLFDAAQGIAGPLAALAVGNLLDATETAIGDEIERLRVSIVTDPRPSIDWEAGSLSTWDDAALARIETLARTIAAGDRVDGYFALCEAMDARLLEERQRLFEDAKAAGIHALRSEGFSLAYFGFGRQCGFTRLTRAFSSGMFDLVDGGRRFAPRDMMALTSGQLHFYLERRHVFTPEDGVDDMADGLARLIVARFRFEPYHVKLAILHAAGFVRWASREPIEALLDAIQAIDANREHIFVSTSIVEALRFLGGLDDSAEEAREGIRAELERASGDLEADDVLDLALTVYVASFDHPYSGVYSEEFNALSDARRHIVIRRALSNEAARTSMSLSWLVRELAAFGDPADAPVMEKFAGLPDRHNSVPQEEWAAFAMATRFLGRHGLDLPDVVGEGNAARAIILIRSLVYAADGGGVRVPAEPTWSALDNLPPGVVIGCLAEMEAALREHDWLKQDALPRLSLATSYPAQVLAAARRYLDHGGEAVHFHRAYHRQRGPDLAFAMLEQFGDRTDLQRLRNLANAPRHARSALRALRKLDSM